MINYFLKITICWGLFYLIYILFLSKETFFKINRWYLLGTLILGLLIPIIPVDLLNLFSKQPTASVPYVSPIVEPIVTQVQIVDTVLAVQTAKEEIRYGLLFLWLIYAIGVLVKLYRFGNGLLKIHRLYQAGTVHQKENYKLVLTKEIHLPFSFFNYLFWSEGTHIEEKDAGTIITHEVAHINQWHSIDTLFLEWLSVLLWFSPPIYWYKKSLKDIHEYLADACVLKDTKTKQYGELLLKQAQSSMQLALASHFLDSQLKKRILMMTKNQSSNQALMKYLSALPLLVLMILVFSNPQVRANLNATAQLSIDYLNPHVNVPDVPPSLLLWIGGDFDREKAKKVLEAAYASEGITMTHMITLASGMEAKVEQEGDRIKELHQAAIFLVRKFPSHIKEVHDLAIEVASEEGYALRFHEDGESIIYRELGPSKEEGSRKIVFDSDTSVSWDKQLLLLNNEVVGPISESIEELGAFSIQMSEVVAISPEGAIEQFGKELGQHGAVNFFTNQFRIIEKDGKKLLKQLSTTVLADNVLVLLNDTIVGFGSESFANLGKLSMHDVLHLSPEEAIKEYGYELGENGSINISSNEFIVVEVNGKKVVRRVAELEVEGNNKKENQETIFIDSLALFIVNGTPLRLNEMKSNSIPMDLVETRTIIGKEDFFMKGANYPSDLKVIDLVLKEDYILIKENLSGKYSIVSNELDVDASFNLDLIKNMPSESFQISVFPNPATNYIQVDISNENESNTDPFLLKVVSIDGREIYEEEMDGLVVGKQFKKIDFADDVKGIVIVTITRGAYSVERKVLVQ